MAAKLIAALVLFVIGALLIWGAKDELDEIGKGFYEEESGQKTEKDQVAHRISDDPGAGYDDGSGPSDGDWVDGRAGE
jgi:hypothetical protein